MRFSLVADSFLAIAQESSRTKMTELLASLLGEAESMERVLDQPALQDSPTEMFRSVLQRFTTCLDILNSVPCKGEMKRFCSEVRERLEKRTAQLRGRAEYLQRMRAEANVE